MKVVGQGTERTLRVRIRVSRPARAQLKLVVAGVSRLQKSSAVKGGTNDLKASVPSSVAKGAAQVRITLKDPTGQVKTYRSSVVIPA